MKRGFSGRRRRRPLQYKTQVQPTDKIKSALSIPSAHLLYSRPPIFFQRACRQCVHESARLSRVICSHAWYRRSHGERQGYRFLLYPLPHALATHYFLRLTRARGKSSQREGNALFDDFWYFWSYKSTIKEKLHYDSSLSEFFSLVRKERKGQKEERIPLLNTFCRLAATGANKVPRPSGNC